MYMNMKKTYENPMLQIVGISKKDIIVTSDLGRGADVTSGQGDAPGRFRDFEWYGE